MNGAGGGKILFVTPPYHSGIPELAGRWMPLAFVHLAAAARDAGVAAEIYDAMAKGDGRPEIERRLRRAQARYVACSAMTATVDQAVLTLALAKEVDPGTVTVLGGIHASFMYREILAGSAAVDFVVIGEGERTLQALLLTLEQGGDPAGVAGIAFRRGPDLVVTEPRALVDNLDSLPAAWDLLEWDDYSYFFIPGSRFAAIGTSRGCRHDCAFCSQQQFWQRSWRGRAPGRVADEIAALHGRYGVDVFLLTDEHPTCEPQRWELFLDELIARDLPVRLILESRAADVIRDRNIFWKYRKAGVTHISIGSGENRSGQEAGGEGGDPVQAALAIIHGHGIVSELSFMLGSPQETPESIRATLKLAQRYNPDFANFFPLTPWPYAELYRAVEPFVRERGYARYNFVDPVIEPEAMTLRQVDGALAECYRKFYMGKLLEIMMMKDTFKRGYLLRATRLIMGSSFVMKRLIGENRAAR
jgi:anaerobic magnesium-protoporphyrin IX monomethyl ester cyclase